MYSKWTNKYKNEQEGAFIGGEWRSTRIRLRGKDVEAQGSRRVVASSGQLRPAVASCGLLWLAVAGYKWLWRWLA